MNVLFPIALQFRLLVCMKHYPVENVYLYTSLYFPIVTNQKSIALCDYCLVYSISLFSNNYRGSNSCSVENNIHFRRECLVSYCSSVKTTVCMKHYPVKNVNLDTSLHFPYFLIRKALLCSITVLCTVSLYFPTTIEVQTAVLLKITFIY